MNDATINIRVSKEVKANAETILKTLNLSMSTAINLFLREISLHRGLPFAVRIPNDVTLSAMREVEAYPDLPAYDNADQLFQALEIEDSPQNP